ncbi:MAG: beta keto-acyl synthase, partial [Bacteroidota bacterium]
YSNYLDGVYEPTTESVADALTGQAVHPIDFPKIIEKAWEDGVRIFIEHGPRNSLSLAINEILRGKEFVTVSMDRFGQSGAIEALRAATELWCNGVPVQLDTLKAQQKHTKVPSALEIEFPLRMSAIVNTKSTRTNKAIINLKTEDMKIMERAPQFAVAKRKKVSTETTESNNEPVSELQLDESVRKNDLPVTHDAFHEMSVEEASFPVSGSILDLFQNQHSSMTEVHDSFLKMQLQAQRDYIQLMRYMLEQVMDTNGVPDGIEAPEYIAETDEAAEVKEMIEEAGQPPDIRVEAWEPEPEMIEVSMPSPIVSEPEEINRNDEQSPELPGLKFSRAQLEILASGKISSVFGPLFEQQDQYDIQVRMPEPPLLLCDRVTGIDAEPGTLGLGTIYTETDVKTDSWYLHNNRMPPGIFIEAGQADLLLISYLGIDFINKGERAYRLLGCELTFYGELPKPGETLKYDIHVDGYAKSGETTLFFFHYDCHINGKLRISVRSGQAGFFSRKELDESKGVIWDPETAEYTPDYSFEYKNATKKTAFSPDEIEAYTLGNMVECFGPELDWTETHTRSPRSQGGYQNFIKNITKFDLHGGPAGRGYLRSETMVSPDDWYFKGHFKNDECMPGTLMADACLQMMAFFMVGAGLTLKKDGWRFEPVTDYKCKFICRGQVIPESKKVVYEIFVDEIVAGDYPAIYAHVLATVDGNKAFLCERSALRLVPDWPLATMPHLIKEDVSDKKIATYKGFRFGYESLINCALGNAAHAFGPEINYYNGVIRSPRLPGPPYHFMTRIQEYKVEPGNYKNDPYVVAAYDIPENVWYFDENGRATMPYAVLMEVALQPCGWFSTFVCQYDIKGKDLVFRNLDGNAVQHSTIVPGDSTIITKTALSGVSIMGEVIIVKFNVACSIEGEEVFTMDTVFGFFDTESMKNQKGLAKTDEEISNVMLEN